MNPKRFFALLFAVVVIAVGAVAAQESSKPKADPEPRAKDGKKLKDMEERILIITPTDFKTGRRHIKGLIMIVVGRAN